MKNRISFDEGFIGLDGEGALRCPNCSGSCLHHGRVLVGVRDGEDKAGSETTVEGGKLTHRRCDDRDPAFSARRDRIRIHFWCENCDDPAVLYIDQHKGNTFMSWKP